MEEASIANIMHMMAKMVEENHWKEEKWEKARQDERSQAERRERERHAEIAIDRIPPM